MGQIGPSKWHGLIHTPKRMRLVAAILRSIQTQARDKGYTGTMSEFVRIMNKRHGIRIAQPYYYAQLESGCRYPFYIESIIGLCEAYEIPLTTIFNPELFKDSPDSPEE